jgi:hypothetical protein
VPRQNRVTPLGELIAVPERGLVYGNRGCLHDNEGRIRRRWATKRWIACRLEFRGWHRGPLMQPGKFTELFFLDEATAFAAGHRPCALCRRDDYRRFTAMLEARGADAIDAQLHEERLAEPRPGEIADGAFVLEDGEPWLVLRGELRRWTPAGYTDRRPLPAKLRVITPPSLVEVLRHGWDGAVPLLHPSVWKEPKSAAY